MINFRSVKPWSWIIYDNKFGKLGYVLLYQGLYQPTEPTRTHPIFPIVIDLAYKDQSLVNSSTGLEEKFSYSPCILEDLEKDLIDGDTLLFLASLREARPEEVVAIEKFIDSENILIDSVQKEIEVPDNFEGFKDPDSLLTNLNQLNYV